MICSICFGEVEKKYLEDEYSNTRTMYWDKGENAAPYEGRCCSKCNDLIVIPTRMGLINPEGIYLGQALIKSKLTPEERKLFETNQSLLLGEEE